MTKFLVFNNDLQNPVSTIPGSDEAIACEIAATVGTDGLSDERFHALPERSKEAKELAKKQAPRFRIDLEPRGKTAWKNAAFDILLACRELDHAIEQANTGLLRAEAKFKQACRKGKYFENLDRVYDMQLSSAFVDLHGSCIDRFIYQVEDAYLVEVLRR